MMSGMTGAPRDRRFTLVLLVVTILHAASADTATDRVSNFVNEYLKKNQIPGCAVTVQHDGKVVFCQGYGVANVEHGVRVTPQTVFQSGSIGKQFTAMAIMMLIEEQKVALEVIIGHGLFDASRFVLFYFQGPPTRSRQSCLLAIAPSNKQTGLSASRPAFLIVTDSRGANQTDTRPAC